MKDRRSFLKQAAAGIAGFWGCVTGPQEPESAYANYTMTVEEGKVDAMILPEIKALRSLPFIDLASDLKRTIAVERLLKGDVGVIAYNAFPMGWPGSAEAGGQQ